MGEMALRLRLFGLALIAGLASQYCVNAGPCAPVMAAVPTSKAYAAG